MTENQTDGNGAVSGGQGDQPSQSSSPITPKPFDGDVANLFNSLEGKLNERFTSIEKNLSERLGRVQGTVDRSQNDFRQWLGQVEQYEKQGLSRDEAISELEADKAADQWKQSLEKKIDDLAGRLGGIGNTNGAQQMVAKVFESYKLDPKDPYVASQLQGKSFANETEAELFAARVFRDKALSPNPNLAQQSSTPGQGTSGSQGDARVTHLQELMKRPSDNRIAIRNLKAELDKEGWKNS